ncbi:hypothetical protein PPERSA_12231 [Pseudocohnilembus persalinus]|uniref:Trm112p-like protein n=1 Tax=Pseudocohnilembus persalinus TaxID=266149 RepID=A0A0V0R552_PSEPJ|nr:hypothetical protein PPERSA_12231 [Pseudocohnilembus persalinus]|eukprot:KRX09488.1 hypothetical protein PPERSA_12231 [Pseudocohnilembus persalinus]
MRLFSHNLLQCNVKNCDKNNYPLKIFVQKSQIVECEFKKEPLLKLINKLDFNALYQTVFLLGDKSFPKELTTELLQDEKFLRSLHRVLMETHIMEGYLQCENCERQYQIANGIPNMILKEDEQ